MVPILRHGSALTLLIFWVSRSSSSPLIFHVGLYSDYMKDYVELGLSESTNGKPSGAEDRCDAVGVAISGVILVESVARLMGKLRLMITTL